MIADFVFHQYFRVVQYSAAVILNRRWIYIDGQPISKKLLFLPLYVYLV